MFALLGRRARRVVRVVGIGMRVAGTTGAGAVAEGAVVWAWCGRRRVDVLVLVLATAAGTAKGCGGPYAGIWNGYCVCACGRCVCWYCCCCCCWGAYAYTGLRERERAVDAVCTRPGGTAIAGVLGSAEAKEREGRVRWNLTRFIGRRV